MTMEGLNKFYYTFEELKAMGISVSGDDVNVSRKTSIYAGKGGITIGNHVRIDDFCVLVGNIEIHDYIHIGSHSGIHASQGGKVVFEDYSGTSSNVQIYASSDEYDGTYFTGRPGLPAELFKPVVGEVHLGKYSQVGTGSVILSKGSLGEGTAVGAMSLVNRKLDPWMIYAGIPVREIRERKKEFMEKLLEVEQKRNTKN